MCIYTETTCSVSTKLGKDTIIFLPALVSYIGQCQHLEIVQKLHITDHGGNPTAQYRKHLFFLIAMTFHIFNYLYGFC